MQAGIDRHGVLEGGRVHTHRQFLAVGIAALPRGGHGRQVQAGLHDARRPLAGVVDGRVLAARALVLRPRQVLAQRPRAAIGAGVGVHHRTLARRHAHLHPVLECGQGVPRRQEAARAMAHARHRVERDALVHRRLPHPRDHGLVPGDGRVGADDLVGQPVQQISRPPFARNADRSGLAASVRAETVCTREVQLPGLGGVEGQRVERGGAGDRRTSPTGRRSGTCSNPPGGRIAGHRPRAEVTCGERPRHQRAFQDVVRRRPRSRRWPAGRSAGAAARWS